MADTKISALTAVTASAGANEFAVNEAGVSKKTSLTQVAAYLQTIGMPQVRMLTSNYTNATTTGTEVTGLTFTGLAAGTYYVCWYLLMQVPTATTSCKFGGNFTGTTTKMSLVAQFPSAGVAAATGTWHNAANATTGQVWAYANTITESTTGPNLGPWIAVTNINVDHFCKVEGIFVVSTSGDLALWAASEVAATMQLSINSCGLLIRMA